MLTKEFLGRAQRATLLAAFTVRARNANRMDVEQILDLVYGTPAVKPDQVRSELQEFSTIIRKLSPQRLLEVGTNRGGTFFVLCQVSSPDATVISVDIPGGPFSDGKSFYRERLLRSMTRRLQKFYRFTADSHLQSTLEKAANTLNGEKLDVLFIDGDHTYNGVKQDFEMYSPLVRSGGIVAFHDIAIHPAEVGCEVDKFWNEVKKSYTHREIIANPDQGWAGIGVLYL